MQKCISNGIDAGDLGVYPCSLGSRSQLWLGSAGSWCHGMLAVTATSTAGRLTGQRQRPLPSVTCNPIPLHHVTIRQGTSTTATQCYGVRELHACGPQLPWTVGTEGPWNPPPYRPLTHARLGKLALGRAVSGVETKGCCSTAALSFIHRFMLWGSLGSI